MEEVPSSTESINPPATPRVPQKRLRVWLIAMSILAIILFLIEAVFSFAIISATVDHLKTGTKSISGNNGMVVPYSVDDFKNDLGVEIPAILLSLTVVVAGPVGGWLLFKRKPGLGFALSLLALLSLITTFLLGLFLVFS
jgi:hypothetical protein